MKKGDLRKQEILNTAEMLFCRKGYEQTGIQDILDVLHASKGSFYHHYVSKEALLEAICANRAKLLFQHTKQIADQKDSYITKLQALFYGMFPLQGEKLSFLLMLLPVFSSIEGKTIRTRFCEAISAEFLPETETILQQAHQANELVCYHPEITADLILSLINRLWTLICDKIITAENMKKESDLSEILLMTEQYGETIEHILLLPYGTIELINIQDIKKLSEQIHNHWPD